MANALTTPAEVPSGSPARPLSILAVASPAPTGWEQGGIELSTTCPSPIVRDKCVTIEDGDEAGRPGSSVFPAFMVEQGVGCSTLSGDNQERAADALRASTEYALGITLLTGAANGGAPSLGDADTVGAFDDPVSAVAAIEAAAVAAGFGQPYVLHATVSAAAWLRANNMISDDGRSPSGAPWIVSPGYGGDAPDEEQRIWATGRVLAGVGRIDTYEAVDRRTNDREAWAVRGAVVGFDTCINLVATFTPPTPGGGTVDPEARSQIETLQQEVGDLQNELDGKANTQHTHAAGDIDSGTLAVARVPSLSISKTTGLQAELDGKANTQHTHAAGDVDSGTLAVARVPSLPISKTTGLQAELDGKLTSVVAGDGISVDDSDPVNPVISTTN